MNYLLVNHIAAAPGRDAAHLLMPADWLADLRATAAALREYGVRLMVATPRVDRLPDDQQAVEIVPDECGFEHAVIPGYLSARQFLQVRAELHDTIARLAHGTDIVQLDDGGHPLPLGLTAFDAAGGSGARRIWVGSSVDPARRLADANAARGVARRLVGSGINQRLLRQIDDVIRRADLVIAHSRDMMKRFGRRWDSRCHLVDRLDIHERQLPTPDRQDQRRRRILSAAPLSALCLGPQTAANGTDHALRAVAHCRRLGVPVELTIAGDGPDLDSFRQLATSLQLGAAVRFVDGSVDPVQLLDAADLLLHCPITAQAEQSLAQPAARGLAAVTYQAPNADQASVGAGERLMGGSAVAVPRGDIDRLADQLLRLATDRAELATRADLALAHVRARTIEASHRTRAALALQTMHRD